MDAFFVPGQLGCMEPPM